MSENINNNVIASGIKFVDFAGLDHFWSIAKAYINAEDANLQKAIDAVAGVVGNDESGLVKDVKVLQAEVAALGGVEGGIQGMIDASIDDLVNNGAVKTNTDAIATLTQTVADNKSAIEGTVAGVEEKVDNHIADAVAHITADERTSWNAAVSKIDTFLKDAELDAEGKNVIDTLKELQSYIESDGSAAEKLISRVAANEAILEGFGTEAGEIANVKTAIATAKSEAIADADGKLATAKTELTEAIATAKFEAIADADGKLVTAKSELTGAIATAKSEAIADADGKLATAKSELTGAIATAKSEAITESNTYADGVAATAESNANAYTDALYNSIVIASLSDIDSIFGVTDHNHEA